MLPTTVTILENDNIRYDIINTYGPEDFQPFFAKYFQKLKDFKNRIMIGDWNVLIKDEMSLMKRSGSIVAKRNKVKQYLENYIDIHEILTTQVNYAYHKGQYSAKLDRVYIKNKSVQNILSYEIIPNSFSDHVSLEIGSKFGKQIKWDNGS